MSIYLNKQYIQNIAKTKCKRDAGWNPVFFSNNIDAFNQIKEDLVNSNVSKETWYKIIPSIQKLLTAGNDYSQINLLFYVNKILQEKGINFIPFEDVRNIVDYFIDEVKANFRPCLSVSVHFDLSTLLNLYYKNSLFDFCEYIILSDLIIIKCLPASLLNAQMESIRRGIAILLSKKDFVSLESICLFGIDTLSENSETYNKCQFNLRKAKNSKEMI